MIQPKRRYFGRQDEDLPKLDLSYVQKESWHWFLTEGVSLELSGISPIDDFSGKNWELVFEDHSLGEPIVTEKQAREKGLTFASPFKIKTKLINKKTGREVSQ